MRKENCSLELESQLENGKEDIFFSFVLVLSNT